MTIGLTRQLHTRRLRAAPLALQALLALMAPLATPSLHAHEATIMTHTASDAVDLAAMQRLLDRHFEIWNAPISPATMAKFQDIYTADFFVADEHGKAVGYEQVAKLIQKVQSGHPDFVFTPAPASWNHGLGRVTWGYGPRSNPNQVRGEDIFTIENGKLSSARVFLDK